MTMMTPSPSSLGEIDFKLIMSALKVPRLTSSDKHFFKTDGT